MDKRESTVRLTRSLDAPRERVFAAWTEARQLASWFGPKAFTVHSCETDPRPGGLFKLCIRSPDGKDYWVRGSYKELRAPERLVIVCTADDDKGVARLEETIDVTLADQQGATRLTLVATASGAGAVAESMLAGMPKGWNQTVDRLDALLSPEKQSTR